MPLTAEDLQGLVKSLRARHHQIEASANASDFLEMTANDIDRLAMAKEPDLEAATKRAVELWNALVQDVAMYQAVLGGRAVGRNTGVPPEEIVKTQEDLEFYFNRVRTDIAEGVHRQSVAAPDKSDQA